MLSAERRVAYHVRKFNCHVYGSLSVGASDLRDIFFIGSFDALMEPGLLEFEVRKACLATGCVSLHRD
jgi:hypothetical protein